MKGLDQVREGTVIFTAHGISPAVVEAARARGLSVVDATCSDVTRTHTLVRRLVDEGFHVVYIGKRGHPEPAGVLGIAAEHTTLIESMEEADQLQFSGGTRLAVTCQTTLSVWDTQAVIDRLQQRFPDIEVHNEICLATQERQEAAVLAADHVDCVVVVGSRRSSNSLRLAQVVKEKAHVYKPNTTVRWIVEPAHGKTNRRFVGQNPPPGAQIYFSLTEPAKKVSFTVQDIDDTLARLGRCGAELVGEVVQYADSYRLCYIRGPEGILIGLAQQLGGS